MRAHSMSKLHPAQSHHRAKGLTVARVAAKKAKRQPKDTDSRKRDTMLGVRLLPEEVAEVERVMAKKNISSRAEFLRQALLRELASA